MTNDNGIPAMPWWRHGYVWLMLSGPAIVVVAGFATFWIAAHGADPVVSAGQAVVLKDKASLPALQGRNHVQTPASP